MAAATENQSHHFIPQFHLRAWAPKDGKLIAFKIIPATGTPVSSRGNVGSACQVENLYALEQPIGGDKFALERDFFKRRIDDPASDAHQAMAANGVEPLSTSQRQAWARYLISIAARSPAVLMAARQHVRTELDADPKEYEALRRPGDPPTLSEFAARHMLGAISDRPLKWLTDLIDDPVKVHAVESMMWWTRRLSGQDLVIGDSPLLSRPEHPTRNGVNLSDPTVLIAIPIGPETMFFASHATEHRKELRDTSPSRICALMNAQTVRRRENYVFGRPGCRSEKFVRQAFAERQATEISRVALTDDPQPPA